MTNKLYSVTELKEIIDTVSECSGGNCRITRKANDERDTAAYRIGKALDASGIALPDGAFIAMLKDLEDRHELSTAAGKLAIHPEIKKALDTGRPLEAVTFLEAMRQL